MLDFIRRMRRGGHLLMRLGLLLILVACGRAAGSQERFQATVGPESTSPTPQVTPSPAVTAVALSGGAGGIGFDDLGYDATRGKVLVPAGRTGNLDLIDPKTLAVAAIGGFSAQPRFTGGHDVGPTSADAGRGFLFVVDRTARRLAVVDSVTPTIVSTATLTSSPDYVRYVATTDEVWVTEPDHEQIEVFALSTEDPPALTAVSVIPVPGGPESLIIDHTRGRAYTHLWAGQTVAIGITRHTILGRWPNGCTSSRGIALDEQRGFLFVGCAEGRAVVLDLTHEGRQLASLQAGAGVDVISYSPTLGHLYLQGAESATLAILGISAAGHLSLLGTIPTVAGAHCVTADDRGNSWVCDPDHGQILRIVDPFPPEGKE